ncbi:hypothetical protein BSK59_15400 [Paenibacillus odorifer]|uniref:hypothetical protein n=1 Tax=Paenibacillus odorifer TaxID=189426 RepID=UPI00096C2FA0|nr:hypothetical protein [Paenibacillus odorifer]OME53965.1 hypothetical protein BSK59_15400 [Paenibacillus odorifer]
MFIFGNKQMVKSPVANQSFIWVAEYADGTHLSEFDFATHKSNSFYHISREKIIKFGLLGENSQIYFDVGNGVFTINGHRIVLSYESSDGVEYPITGRTIIYNDIITYKDTVADISPFAIGSGAFSESINQFNVGYKKQMEFDDVNIGFQCVVGIPLNAPVYLQFKITSDSDLNGKLIIRRNGQIVDIIDAPLLGGHALQGNWNVI